MPIREASITPNVSDNFAITIKPGLGRDSGELHGAGIDPGAMTVVGGKKYRPILDHCIEIALGRQSAGEAGITPPASGDPLSVGVLAGKQGNTLDNLGDRFRIRQVNLGRSERSVQEVNVGIIKTCRDEPPTEI
jgi:hypothetical protein